MKPVLKAYLLGLSAPAVAVAAVLPALPAAAPADPTLALILVGLAVVAANYQVMVTPRYKADAAPAIDFAIVMLFSPAAAVALVGLGRIAGELILTVRRNPVTGRPRRAAIDVVFNTSQLMLAAAAGATIFTGITSGRPGAMAVMAAAAAATAIAMYTVNTAFVVVAAGLHNSRSPISVWVESAVADLGQTAALYAAGFVLGLCSS